MATTSARSFSPAITLPPFLKFTPRKPSNSLLCANFFKPVAVSKTNPTLELSRLKLTHATAVAQKPASWAWVISACDSGAYPDAEASDSKRDATIDIKLPRGSLLVEFTCDGCGERTKRLINRLAYECELVYVQCAGCEQYHKLVDNLGIVVEYDLQEEMHKDEA